MGSALRRFSIPGPVIESLHSHIRTADPGGVLGVYLFGSVVVGGLRTSSDIDVLVLTQRSLSRCERQALVEFLLRCSSSKRAIPPSILPDAYRHISHHEPEVIAAR